MPFIDAPTSVASLDEALTVAQELIDRGQQALFASAAGADISCRAGCTSCCRQAVPVGPAELRGLHEAIEKLPPALRAGVRRRISATADRLRSIGFHRDDIDRRADLSSAYFAADVPCPLLDGGSCVVRGARPLACREYLVVSDPVHCGTPPTTDASDDGQVVRIRLRHDVLTSYSRHEREARVRGRQLLALALDEPMPEPTLLSPQAGRDVLEALTRTAHADVALR